MTVNPRRSHDLSLFSQINIRRRGSEPIRGPSFYFNETESCAVIGDQINLHLDYGVVPVASDRNNEIGGNDSKSRLLKIGCREFFAPPAKFKVFK